MPAATSTFSTARWTSARASSIVFPWSCAMILARTSASRSIRARRAKNFRARSRGGVSRHAGNAACAAATAAPTVSFAARGT